MDTAVSVVAIFVLVGVLSTAAGRLITRKKALWVWDHSTPIGWILIVLGVAHILVGLLVDQGGTGMSVKLGFGSLLLIAGLWMIW